MIALLCNMIAVHWDEYVAMSQRLKKFGLNGELSSRDLFKEAFGYKFGTSGCQTSRESSARPASRVTGICSERVPRFVCINLRARLLPR
jgi:hypothetical protein